MSDTAVLVGLVGGAGCGKSRVAAAMARLGFCRLAFADALRLEVSQAWHIDPLLLTESAPRERPSPALAAALCTDRGFVRWALERRLDLLRPRSPRWVMQHWGTDFRRAQNPTYWTRVVQGLAQRRLGAGKRRIVVGDVRMPDEADLLRRRGGLLLRVRSGASSALERDARCHVTEARWPWITVDGEIRSDGTAARLDQQVKQALSLHGLAADEQAHEVAS